MFGLEIPSMYECFRRALTMSFASLSISFGLLDNLSVVCPSLCLFLSCFSSIHIVALQ